MTTITQVLDKLENVRKSGREYAARCPSHDDRRNSLSLRLGDSGKILLHCHAGCKYADIAARLGIAMPESKKILKTARRIVATYDYRDEHGNVLYQAVRYDPKDFVQRRPAGKASWNYSLNGTRRVLYHLPEIIAADDTQTVFVVEGEKDADNLSRIGLLATTNVAGAGKWRAEYSESLRGRDVCVIPDNDDPGRKHANQVAQSLNGKAASIKILELPGLPKKGDVSDWISQGGDAAQLTALCNAAPMFSANGNGAHVESAAGEAETDVPSITDQAGQYVIRHGRICRHKRTQDGAVTIPLCNFTAQIVEEVAHDDGADVTRFLTIEGEHANGRTLAPARVDASQFASLRWVTPSWGSLAIVEAGVSAQDHLRAAIQHLSTNVATRHVYAHTGWREIDGKRVFLTQSGAVGGAPVSVELHKELERIALPTEPRDVPDALRESLRFLEIAPKRVTVPLWAATYLAPLAEIIPLRFMIWVFGATGVFKSALAAVALSHYGDFTQDDLLPWNGTSNSLEKYPFIAKDVPLVIDDFAPQTDQVSAQKIEQLAARLVRDVGNHAGRARMRSDLSLRAIYRPRGLVISTGEQLPNGQSLVGRLVTVEVNKGDVDLARLSEAQDNRVVYPDATAAYVLWLADQWAHLKETLPRVWRELRTKARRGEQHARLPESIASLYVGYDLGLAFAVERGALDAPAAQTLREEGWAALCNVAASQHRITEEQRPTRRFLTVIGELISQSKARLNPTDTPDATGDGELLGWRDADYLYLLPSASYHCVAKYERDEGRVFGMKENALRKMLAEENLSVTGGDGHYTARLWINGQNKRVLKVLASGAEKMSGVSLRQSG